MTVASEMQGSVTAKAVNPTETTLDTFEPGRRNVVWIFLENTDGSQTLQGGVKVRPVAGSGSWAAAPTHELEDIAAGEARFRPIDVSGAGEVRIVGTASGAGLTANYGRRNVIS